MARSRRPRKSLPSGVITVMFTDIANSSELKVLMDGNTSARRDAKFRSDIKEPHDNIVLTCIEAAGGYKGNSTGDGYYFTFTDAEEAVLCALQIQERLCTNPINTPLNRCKFVLGFTQVWRVLPMVTSLPQQWTKLRVFRVKPSLGKCGPLARPML